jgi:hypothetical protein
MNMIKLPAFWNKDGGVDYQVTLLILNYDGIFNSILFHLILY